MKKYKQKGQKKKQNKRKQNKTKQTKQKQNKNKKIKTEQNSVNTREGRKVRTYPSQKSDFFSFFEAQGILLIDQDAVELTHDTQAVLCYDKEWWRKEWSGVN